MKFKDHKRRRKIGFTLVCYIIESEHIYTSDRHYFTFFELHANKINLWKTYLSQVYDIHRYFLYLECER